MGVQLKTVAKLFTVTELSTKHVYCRIILYYIKYTCDNFSELFRKISPADIFLIYKPSPLKILVQIGPVVKEVLIQPEISIKVILLCNTIE